MHVCRALKMSIKDAPDPSNWTISSDTNKTKTEVVYEWGHVLRNGEAHRATCCANDICYKGRRVPMNPLRSCPTNLQFSLEWMEAVASNVRAGIKYHGVTYESEKPDFVYDLPSGGIDIQHESCHWILPDGRCVAWSVAELSEKKLDELLDPNARELYYAVGSGSLT